MNSELEKIAYVYGDVCLRKKKERRKRQKILVLELLFDYAKNSTLHGFRYIVDQGLNILERCFWVLTVIVSIVLCSFYIYNVVMKWKTSPVIVTVNERLASVGSIPFPSVTICSQMKINQMVYNYTEKLEMFEHNTSLWHGEEFTKFQNIESMCDFSIFNLRQNDRYITSSTIKDMTEVAPSLEDIFDFCYWPNADTQSCNALFIKVLTKDGVCFTANSLSAKDIFKDTIQTEYSYMESNTPQMGWSMEDGYNDSMENSMDRKNIYPRRGRAFGANPDLTLYLDNNPDKGDRTCNTMFTGYKIYIHHPADLPQSSLHYYAALPNQLSSVAISFHELNSDSDLIKYDINVRQCYFPSERELYYFKIYTAANCHAECLSNTTYLKCSCVGYYMPRNNSMKICNHAKEETKICMEFAQDLMAIQERKGDLGLDKRVCRCLPACNAVEYDAEILKTNFRFQEFLTHFGRPRNYNPLTTYSKIDLYYKKPQFVTMQRRELFGFTEMLANIGGLLGLFLGFSFLSLIEIFYFMTIRVGFILKRDLDEEKLKGTPRIDEIKQT